MGYCGVEDEEYRTKRKTSRNITYACMKGREVVITFNTKEAR